MNAMKIRIKMLSIRKYKVRNDDAHAAPTYGVKVMVVVSDNQTLNGVSTKLQPFERTHLRTMIVL